MFTQRFQNSVCEGDSIECDVDGFTIRARIEPDPDHGAPWDAEHGHGPVSDWTTRDKRPGERILDSGMRSGEHRFYDFAEAVKIARRDGWGSHGDDGLSPGAKAARAAEADFKRLKAWCDDEWFYVGVVLSVHRAGVDLVDNAAALWGIESDAGDYLTAVASLLLPEALDRGRAVLKRLAETA